MDRKTQQPIALGSLLRLLLEQLDGDLERLYRETGVAFRPKYFPLVRVLLRNPRIPLARLADECGVTHSAISQTVAEMAGRGLVETHSGKDARERLVSLSATAKRTCARLEPLWEAVHAAAAELDAELAAPLSEIAAEALAALRRRPFADRIREHLSQTKKKEKTP
jgi:DNA-binding MarR family transcriptional regulator